MTSDAAQLSRRERQIMEIVYEHGRATEMERILNQDTDAARDHAVRSGSQIGITFGAFQFAGLHRITPPARD